MKIHLNKKIVLRNTDMITGAVIVILSLFLLLYAIPYQISTAFSTTGNGAISQRAFPYIVSIVMLICGLSILKSGYSKYKRLQKHTEDSPKDSAEDSIEILLVSIVVIALGVIATVLLKPLGYLLTSGLTTLALYYICGGRKLHKGVILAAVFAVVTWVFFYVYLKLSIPLGFGY